MIGGLGGGGGSGGAGLIQLQVPVGSNPGFLFGGLDSFGYVATDADGQVLAPVATDVVCDDLGTIDPVTRQYMPGREPRENYRPPGAKVRVEFQGFDALVEGSREVDPLTLTTWSSGATVANGRQFLRWRVTFTIADDTHPFGPLSPRPVVQQRTVHADFRGGLRGRPPSGAAGKTATRREQPLAPGRVTSLILVSVQAVGSRRRTFSA